MSLKSALEQLGLSPCNHMLEISSERAAMWLDAARGNPVDWHRVLAGYRATVDWPGCAFYRQIMASFPKAKVILTLRDPEAWYESAVKTIHERPSARPEEQDEAVKVKMIRAVVWEGSMRGSFDDKDRAIALFNEHNREVVRTVPPERLLIFNAKDGWEPLCEFLDLPVPSVPYPHLNQRDVFNSPDAFQQMIRDHTTGAALAG
jgi:hypothetical protein